MKHTWIVGLVLVVVAACLLGTALAGEEEQPKKITLSGTVAVTKNDEGAVTAVCLKKGDAMTKLCLDDKGKEVAAQAGKAVEVVGAWQGEGDAKMLKVESCKVIEEKKE